MAILYNGGTRISLGATREVIKEVPTEQDLTLMGNELRKACAYTHTENVSGMYQIVKTVPASNIYYISDPFEVNSFVNFNCISSSVVIDGKLYYYSVSSGKVILTQNGTDTDWTLYNYNVPSIKNNKFYKNGTYYNVNVNNPYFGDYSNVFVNDGKLYNNNCEELTNFGSGWTIVNRTGSAIWGIKNGYLYVWSYDSPTSATNLTQVTDFTVSEFCYGKINSSCYIGIGNIIYNSSGTVLYTYDSPIIQMAFNSFKVLLENGKLYNGNSLVSSNVKRLIAQTGYTDGYVTNDGKIYNLNNGSLIGELKKENFTIFDSKQKGYSENNISFLLCNSNNAEQKTTYYCPNIDIKNKIYQSPDNILPNYTTTSYSDTSFIFQNKEYIRDYSQDSTFSFVPDELSSHTFTDQELCQAYLNAGFIQQQNNNS